MRNTRTFFSAEPPEDAGHDSAEERTKQQSVAEKRYAEKARANGADEKQGTGIIGENEDMLGFFQKNQFFFIKLSSDFCAYRIAGEDAQKKGKGGNAIQPKEGLCQWAQQDTYSFRSTDAQKEATGCHERKQGRKYFRQPELNAFRGSGEHGGRIPQKGVNQKTGTEAQKKSTFFQKITSFQMKKP